MSTELDSALATAREMEQRRENVIEGALAMHETDMDAVQRAVHRIDAAALLRAKIEALDSVWDPFDAVVNPTDDVQAEGIDEWLRRRQASLHAALTELEAQP